MLRTTSSMRASGITTRWFLAPPIAWKRLLVCTQASAMARQVALLPTTETPGDVGMRANIASATSRSAVESG